MRASVILLAAMSLARVGPAQAEDEITFRGIIRAGVDRHGVVHGEFAKATGLAKATSLTYKILVLEPNGSERVVDEKTAFRIGQMFRLRVEADTDVYLYVFHEDPKGKQSILLPDRYDDGRVPMLRRGEVKDIPDDGTYFEFVAPAGTERLKVFATPEKQPNLTPKEAFDRKLDSQKEIELKTQRQETFSRDDKSKQVKTSYAGRDPKELVASVMQEDEYRLRDFRWEPEADENLGKTVFKGSHDKDAKPEIFVDISLTSTEAK